MCDYDYEVPDFCSSVFRKSIKFHECVECNRKINIKEKYRNISGKWGKKVTSYKICYQCSIAQDLIDQRCGGFVIGNIRNELFDHHEKDFDVCRMLIGLRRKWKKFKSNNLIVLKNKYRKTHG